MVDDPRLESGEGERWFNLREPQGINGSKGIPINLNEEMVEELVCFRKLKLSAYLMNLPFSKCQEILFSRSGNREIILIFLKELQS